MQIIDNPFISVVEATGLSNAAVQILNVALAGLSLLSSFYLFADNISSMILSLSFMRMLTIEKD